MKARMRCLVCLIAALCCLAGTIAFAEEDGIACAGLADDVSRARAHALLESAGISPEREEVFRAHVEQINAVMEPGMLPEGFEAVSKADARYNPYDVQDTWDAAYPGFPGYNCRITAFGLYGDFIEVDAGAEIRDEALFMDLISLEEDASALIHEDALHVFRALFSTIPTEGTRDQAVHIRRVQEDWRARGIRFLPNERARLITVFFHEQFAPGEDELFIGHAGLLFPEEDDSMYFLEKVAFQEPYRLLRFQSREDLNHYLMDRYDVAWDQPTASPFAFENDAPLLPDAPE